MHFQVLQLCTYHASVEELIDVIHGREEVRGPWRSSSEPVLGAVEKSIFKEARGNQTKDGAFEDLSQYRHWAYWSLFIEERGHPYPPPVSVCPKNYRRACRYNGDEKAKDAWLDFVRASRLVRIEPDEDSCNSFWCDMKVFHSIGGSRKARKMGLVIEAE